MFFEDIIFKPKNNNMPALFDEKNGFMYGNMYKNEYVPYKNYKVSRVSTNTEKGDLLLKIYEYDFALNDLSLYLDLHPENDYVYDLFKEYTEKERNCVEVYEKKYGPLELNDSNYNDYMWVKGPWPFEGGKFNV